MKLKSWKWCNVVFFIETVIVRSNEKSAGSIQFVLRHKKFRVSPRTWQYRFQATLYYCTALLRYDNWVVTISTTPRKQIETWIYKASRGKTIGFRSRVPVVCSIRMNNSVFISTLLCLLRADSRELHLCFEEADIVRFSLFTSYNEVLLRVYWLLCDFYVNYHMSHNKLCAFMRLQMCYSVKIISNPFNPLTYM